MKWKSMSCAAFLSVEGSCLHISVISLLRRRMISYSTAFVLVFYILTVVEHVVSVLYRILLCLQRLYKEHGESMKHHYTQTAELPEILQAKQNALNISEVRFSLGPHLTGMFSPPKAYYWLLGICTMVYKNTFGFLSHHILRLIPLICLGCTSASNVWHIYSSGTPHVCVLLFSYF